MGRADLHIHSQASDGALAAEDVLEAAIRAGLAAFSLADHDTVAGWQKLQSSPRLRHVQLVPAVELSTEQDEQEIHIVGYCFTRVAVLDEQLGDLRDSRWIRARQMLERLQQLGISITWAELLAISGEAAPGRLHLARLLQAAGVVNSLAHAFDRYLLPGRPAYVPRHRLSPQAAVACIRRAGGVAVLAHPGPSVSERLLNGLVEVGLQGIEAYHPAHDAGAVARSLRLALEHDLVPTGGSDYHGFGDGTIGSHTVSMTTVRQLERLAWER